MPVVVTSARLSATRKRTWCLADRCWDHVATKRPKRWLTRAVHERRPSRAEDQALLDGVVSFQGCARTALASRPAAIRPIATSSFSLVYLRASWTKANLPRGRGAKPKGLFLGKVAGLPKGACL